MKVSRTMAYALQALLQLAVSDTDAPVSCSYMARSGQMPERFLLQILRSMVNSGILKSIRGVDGGYLLAKQPKDITLLDIYEAFDTPIVPSIPPLASLPDAVRQKLSAVMNRVASSARKELSTVTVADLIQKQQKVSKNMF